MTPSPETLVIALIVLLGLGAFHELHVLDRAIEQAMIGDRHD